MADDRANSNVDSMRGNVLVRTNVPETVDEAMARAVGSREGPLLHSSVCLKYQLQDDTGGEHDGLVAQVSQEGSDR